MGSCVSAPVSDIEKVPVKCAKCAKDAGKTLKNMDSRTRSRWVVISGSEVCCRDCYDEQAKHKKEHELYGKIKTELYPAVHKSTNLHSILSGEEWDGTQSFTDIDQLHFEVHNIEEKLHVRVTHVGQNRSSPFS